jgi:protease IV
VLGGKFVIRELMGKASIRRECLMRGVNAEYASWFTPFSEEQAAKLQKQLDEFYREDFVKKVALGRKLPEDEVDRVGRGRVWSGIRAQQFGLVDAIGGPLEAIQEARRLAGIPDRKKIRLIQYHRRRRLLERLVPEISTETMADPANYLQVFQRLARDVILAWLPYQIRIR